MNMPNRLKVKDGALVMIDGTDVTAYLKSKTRLEGQPVVVILKDDAEALLRDALRWRAHMDEQFSLCA